MSTNNSAIPADNNLILKVRHMNFLDHIEKTTHPQPNASIIWLHGFGADASDFLSIVPLFSAEENFKLRFIFPNAPLRTIPNYPFPVRAWFEINNFVQPIDFNQNHIYMICDELAAFITREQERGISKERIFIGGFSQGGMQALFCGLLSSLSLGGIMGLSTVLPPTTVLTQRLENESPTPPIFLAHGYYDEVIPFSLGEKSKKFLIEAKCDVTWKAYNIGHKVNSEELNDLKEWLQHKLQD